MLKQKLQSFGHLIRKANSLEDSDAGKDWQQEEKGVTEDEMVGWHHQLSGHEFEQTQGDGEGQGSLVCCSPWGRKETRLSDWTTGRVQQEWSQAFSLDIPITGFMNNVPWSCVAPTLVALNWPPGGSVSHFRLETMWRLCLLQLCTNQIHCLGLLRSRGWDWN